MQEPSNPRVIIERARAPGANGLFLLPAFLTKAKVKSQMVGVKQRSRVILQVRMRGIDWCSPADHHRHLVEGRYPVVPDPEPLPAPGEVDVLGREPQHPGAGAYRLLPLYGPAAEGAGPVVEAPPRGC